MSAQVIGYLGENGVRDVRIPIGHLLDKWQGLRPLLVMVPVGGSDDEAYPVQYTLDGTDLVWHVSDADTAVAGTTKAAVRMVDDDGRVGMDEPFQVIISPNLSSGGEPPVVIKPWVDKLATLVSRTEAAAERAESATERAESAAERVETGTAPNALAFDGKPPSYYLPVENLLDNSDWRIKKNIINQRGETVYNNAGYWIDRWYAGITGTLLDGQNHFEVVSGEGIKLTSPANGYVDFYQNLENYSQLKGKPVTVAAKIIYKGEEKIAVNNFIAGEADGKVPLTADELVTVYSIDALNFLIRVFNAKNEQPSEVIICWIALYEGIFAANTLPPFVPRPYAVELAECRRRFRNFKIKEGNKTFAIGFARSTTQLVFTMNLEGLDVSNLPLGVPSFTQRGYLKIIGNDKTIKGVTAVLDSFIDGVAKLNISTSGLTAGYSYLVLSDLDDADSTITELAYSSDL